MKKLMKEFKVDEFFASNLEDVSLEEAIKYLQEKLTEAKNKYPNHEYFLDSYLDYDTAMLGVYAKRLETDEEYNKRIEEEKQRILNNKKYWDSKAKELGIEAGG